MTTMRALHTHFGTARTINGRVALWLFGLAAGVGMLYAPFAGGDTTLLRWTWPIGAAILFFSIRGLGAVANEQLGETPVSEREDSVSRWLGRLGGKAHVLHYVDVGPRSIEYVVVAPTGVFAIRTRGHRGKLSNSGETLMLNGRQLPPEVVVGSRIEANLLEQRLAGLGFSYPVRPLLVFTDAHTDVRSVGEVTALPLRWLESFIRHSPGTMSPLESTLVAGALKRDARATITR